MVGTCSDIVLCGVLDPLCLLSEDHTCRTDIGEMDWQGLCGALIHCACSVHSRILTRENICHMHTKLLLYVKTEHDPQVENGLKIIPHTCDKHNLEYWRHHAVN